MFSDPDARAEELSLRLDIALGLFKQGKLSAIALLEEAMFTRNYSAAVSNRHLSLYYEALSLTEEVARAT